MQTRQPLVIQGSRGDSSRRLLSPAPYLSHDESSLTRARVGSKDLRRENAKGARESECKCNLILSLMHTEARTLAPPLELRHAMLSLSRSSILLSVVASCLLLSSLVVDPLASSSISISRHLTHRQSQRARAAAATATATAHPQRFFPIP